MCVAIPSRVIFIEGQLATVECFGVHRMVSTMLLPEPAELGDYVTVLAGSYAVEKVTPEMAAESLRIFKSVVDDFALVAAG
ncbi:HypC/HybG/HupF family hydrogenase formation chaperone [Telmatobacter bradus]|uniref:HypC/HybG/HupF family hydrogenase formation chaperone n=1 Tax=Telmatobacter bradus TaxID=474953 RepID=UPI003B4299DC